MENFLFQNRRVLLLITSTIFWILFFFIWGQWGWNDAHVGSKWWWFDNFGHVISGSMLGINALAIIRTFCMETKRPYGKNLLIAGFWIQGVLSVFVVLFLATFVWEGMELYSDFVERGNPEHILAQSAPEDTYLDILLTTLGSVPGIMTYVYVVKHFFNKYVDIRVHEAHLMGEAFEISYNDWYKSSTRMIRKMERSRIKKSTVRKFFIRSLRV